MIPIIKQFNVEAELIGYVDALNDAGEWPEIAIIDSSGVAALVCLQAPGGDGWGMAYYGTNDEDGYIRGEIDTSGFVEPRRYIDSWQKAIGDWEPRWPVLALAIPKGDQ